MLRADFRIPETRSLTKGGGVGRILVSGAIATPKLLAPIEKLEAVYPGLIHDFKIKPVQQVSLIGGLIAERPLLDEDIFLHLWRGSGLRFAIATAPVNPLFRAHIHRLVRIQLAYCELYGLSCLEAANIRHFNHLKPLRYLLHAT